MTDIPAFIIIIAAISGTFYTTNRDLKGLIALGQEDKMKRYICVSLETRPRQIQGVEILPYASFLERLWGGAFA